MLSSIYLYVICNSLRTSHHLYRFIWIAPSTNRSSSPIINWRQNFSTKFLSLFPVQNDPCRDKLCGFGAQCVVSLDGHNASCVCPDECRLSDGDDGNSQTVCGSDGADYKNQCEINRAACLSNANISIIFRGRCGKWFLHLFHSQAQTC